ncbi:MAG: sulfotransferase family protein [Gemmatimonadota bacterium]
MTLRVIGAGVGRTGTMSLKVALERLLGGPCYHMVELFQHPDHVALWHSAARGEMPDWPRLFDGYEAAVDWPASAIWTELSQAFPDALIVLSLRDPDSWWKSASETIFASMPKMPNPEWRAMIQALLAARFTDQIADRDACLAAYERHIAHVRATASRGRLLEWRAEDGWAPLCAALGLPVPDEPFPRANTKADFLAMVAGHQNQAPPLSA